MSRINRVLRVKVKEPEQPLSTWTPAALKTELARLETDPGDLNAWQVFKRRSEIENEQWRREREAPCHE